MVLNVVKVDQVQMYSLFTDQILVAMKMNIKLKTLKRGKRKQKWNMERLKMNNIPF